MKTNLFSGKMRILIAILVVGCTAIQEAASAAEVIIWGAAQAVTNVPSLVTNLATVTGGDFHAVALNRDGAVQAWGANVWGGGVISGVTNVPSDATNVVAVAAGAAHSLALRADGSLAMWGKIVGTGSGPFTSTVSSEATNVVALAPGTGAWHALVLRGDGTVVDWGRTLGGLTNIPFAARHIVSVAAGSWHAVALRADGRVVSWGDEGSGRTNVPPSATNIVAIAASEAGTAALRADGTVLAWANNTSGTIAGLNNVVDIACPFRPSGFSYSTAVPVLALKRDGKVQQTLNSSPSSATNIAAIAGTSDNGIAMVGTGSPTFPGLAVHRTVVSGARAYFRALATGAWPLGYQWRSNGVDIARATNTVLVITNVQPSYMAAYSLVASNAFGLSTNASMLLTVLPVEIMQEPVDRLQYLGGTVSFTVGAEGQGPLVYQWRFGEQPLASGTNTILTLTNLQAGDAGAYSVIVSNVYGSTTSRVAQLTLQPILLTAQPANQTLLVGSNKVLSVSVSGAAPLAYQWQLNSTNLPLATNATLSLSPTTLADAGTYTLIITNGYGATNVSFSVSVLPTLVTKRPGNQPMFRGGTASFLLEVQALIPVSYQWYREGQALSGETSPSLTLSNVMRAQAGTFSVVLSNQYEVTTNSAWLAVVDVAAWGPNFYQTNVPASMTNLTALAKGTSHSLVLTAAGQVTGWGSVFSGETSHPAGLTNCVAIAAGSGFSSGLQADGRVVAWGGSSSGRTNVPVDLTNAVAIASGFLHSLGLRSDGTVRAWGDNRYGQTNVPSGLADVVSIAAGQFHALALKADGTVTAWGAGTNASGSNLNYGQAMVPTGLSNVVQVAGAGDFSLALKSDGTLAAWGRAALSGDWSPPPGLSNVVAISVAFIFGFALQADGGVVSWGHYNGVPSDIPAGLTNVIAIAANPNDEGCLALVGDGPPAQHAVLAGPFFSTNGIAVTVPTQSGRVYRLEYVTNLATPEWIALPLAAGNGTNLTLVDPSVVDNSSRFYRVRRW